MSLNQMLNIEQKKAVQHRNGPLLVVAGAGTGKTHVIAERIRKLIQERKVNPQEILALTFTEKASSEMLHRVDDVMPLGYEEPWIYTFHSFADRILRVEGLEIGLDTSYRIMSYSEQWLLFRQNLFAFNLNYYRPLGNPTKFISAILKFISRLQDENIKPEDLDAFANNFKGSNEERERWHELSGVYKRYEELKVQKSVMDFGDLIMWAIKLFEQRPNILKKYQDQFRHILVDEFQDTNYAQYEIIKLLCPTDLGERSLLVVGDDSQSIYKFRGAAVSNILEFQKDYPKVRLVTLLKNYRSGQPILDAAYKLIKNNNPDSLESKLKISKKLVSTTDTGDKPEIFQVPTIEDEVELVVSKILEILGKEPHYTYKDFAILARANNHLDPFVLALRKYGLPYQLVGNRGLYDRDEIRDILAILKTLINPLDSISLYRVLNIDVLDIPHISIVNLLSQSKLKKESLWKQVEAYSDEKIKDLYEKITYFSEKIPKVTPVELVYEVVNSIGYLNQFIQEETVENSLCIKNLDLFLNIVKKFEVNYRKDTKEIPTLIDFVSHIELMIEAGDNPAQAEIEDIDTINLLTVHSSKGLEFPVVFLVNLVGDRFPTRERKDKILIPDELIKEVLPSGDPHIQEERRLFYVGMTRAQKYLYLVLAKSYGGRREKVPSGFINETGLKIQELTGDDIKKMPSQATLFGVETGFREPKLAKISDFEPKFLSYTQIATYKVCPLKYKYAYVLRIPTAPSHALSFGITIHDTLRDFHSKLMFGDVSLDDFIAMYEKNWQPLGYLNEEHRNHRFESGKELLKRYYENFDKSIKPLGLEKSFNVRIGGIKFYGRIDRIDPLENGSVEIIDYKTGNSKTQKDVDKDDQVSIYAIAAKEALNLNPKKLTFYFLESNEKISSTRTEKELDAMKKEIGKLIKQIKSGDFEPAPGMPCNWCDYKDICPFVWKG